MALMALRQRGPRAQEHNTEYNMIYERETIGSSGLLQHNLKLGAVRHEGPCQPN